MASTGFPQAENVKNCHESDNTSYRNVRRAHRHTGAARDALLVGGYTLSQLSSRFWSKVDRRSNSECWPWLGFCDSAMRL
jgi:hypothetical protein